MSDEEIKTIVNEIAGHSDDLLRDISAAVVMENGGEQLTLVPADVIRIAKILDEIQRRSFALGVQMGMQTVMQVLEKVNHEPHLLSDSTKPIPIR